MKRLLIGSLVCLWSGHAQITQPEAVLRGYEVASKDARVSAPAINQMNMEGIHQGSIFIECPGNKMAVGGGAGITEPSNFILVESKPYFKGESHRKARGWYARFAGANGPGAGNVTVYSVCIADNQ